MTRALTKDEKIRFHDYFVNLNVDKAVVSGEATTDYNCIAWTVGITNAWIWPGSTIGDFDKFYKTKGYTRTTDSNSPIAAWGYAENKMTHGSVSGKDHGP
ncbi:MAG: hypothetical protein NTV43_15810 [Methylococcales bacterium]|nr:hypothetical protein [Methylococcales bacterium]